jgi:hypothetical protein
MSSVMKYCCAGLMLALLSGCVQIFTLIKVNPDGSGTVEQTMIPGTTLVGMMQMMGDSTSFFDEDNIRAQAEKMGKGVRYVSSTPVSKDGNEGIKAIFSFSDINALRVSSDSGMDLMSSESLTIGSDDAKEEKDMISFEFRKGSPSTLIVHVPAMGGMNDSPAADMPPTEDSLQTEMALSMMKPMLEGMTFSVALDVQGDIQKSDATHQEGNMITLVHFEIDQLLNDDALFRKFMDSPDKPSDEVMSALAEEAGFKFELKDRINVTFD